MDHIAVVPGLITVTILAIGALGIAWWSHRDSKRPKEHK